MNGWTRRATLVSAALGMSLIGAAAIAGTANNGGGHSGCGPMSGPNSGEMSQPKGQMSKPPAPGCDHISGPQSGPESGPMSGPESGPMSKPGKRPHPKPPVKPPVSSPVGRPGRPPVTTPVGPPPTRPPVTTPVGPPPGRPPLTVPPVTFPPAP